MIKKYLIPGILLAGCAVAFIIFSLLVFMTKGKSTRLLKQKLLLGTLLISLTGALTSCQFNIAAITRVAAPKMIRQPLCYVVAEPPIEFSSSKTTAEPTPLCYVVAESKLAANAKINPLKTPTCYIALPPEMQATAKANPIDIPTCYFAVSAKDNTENVKTAIAPDHLCYAPVQLG